MTFYRIETNWEPEIIGVTNGVYQCELIEKGFHRKEQYAEIMNDFSSTQYWDRTAVEPIKEYTFNYFKLLKKAKITNIISFCPNLLGCHFLLDNKAKALLAGLDLPNCHFFPAELYSPAKEQVSDSFYVLYSSFHDFETIDYSHSVFFRRKGLKDKEYLTVSCLEDFKTELKKDALIGTELIALKKEYANSDIISTQLGGPFVSEKLLDRWISFDLTGFKQTDKQRLIIL